MKSSLRVAFIAIALAIFQSPALSRAADHLEAPALSSNGSVDLADLFLFQAPNANNAVMILTVNPFAGSLSGTTFNSNATYEFQFDNDGDSIADITYSTSFSAPVAGAQTYTVSRIDSAGSSTIATGVTGAQSTTTNGGLVQAGLFDDPFFFDLQGFNNNFNFTGNDTFAGSNVNAIVLELPSADFIGGSNDVGAQAVTTLSGIRADRVGRPAIATALIAQNRRDAFNAGDPANDFADFGSEVNAAIAGLSNQANADALTPVLLPDLLTFDVSDPGGFLNGRRLEDDVIDASLNLLSAGAVTGDLVDGNDQEFLNVFPFLAPAAVPEPSSGVFLGMVLGLGLLRRRK